MCKQDHRIIQPLPGEIFSISAQSLTENDCKKINEFILFARLITKLKKQKPNGK